MARLGFTATVSQSDRMADHKGTLLLQEDVTAMKISQQSRFGIEHWADAQSF